MRLALLAALLSITSAASAQFTLQTSNTNADLRGIHNVGNGVAWASGTNGTVLRTEDGGYVWQTCSIPPGAEKLDFRGIQAFDANTAIVMSSGPGDQSRLYKTTDGCHTWKLLFKNPDKDGFWDAIQMWTPADGFLAGDPVDGFLYFAESTSYWNNFLEQGEDADWKAKPGEGAFAASNSSLALGPFRQKDGEPREVWFATGGSSGPRIFHYKHFNGGEPERQSLTVSDIAGFEKINSAGIFSIKFRDGSVGIAVGGNYKEPDRIGKSAVYTTDGDHWSLASTPPHGYRSSVAFDPATKIWITVGPNGTDSSTDDGRNWHPVHPDPALHEPADADRNWNALSLPYVVGPKGRIGRLDPAALKSRP
ncbi:hypothetical protein [Occallatibacter savannae]|uniref:hypothetical protein n=1 Tax=Occallatibacter savannae TaxID=1002691 RepID=UPI000D68AAE9|nr:hypothetical protein [Occallatibacter savannae]